MMLMKNFLVFFLMLLICIVNLSSINSRSIASIKKEYRNLKHKYRNEIRRLFNNRYLMWIYSRKLRSKNKK